MCHLKDADSDLTHTLGVQRKYDDVFNVLKLCKSMKKLFSELCRFKIRNMDGRLNVRTSEILNQSNLAVFDVK